MNKKVALQDLGFKDYKETWDYQEALFKQIVDTKVRNRREDAGLETPNHFLFVEHPHVYTLGKSGDINNLLVDEQKLAEKGATFTRSIVGEILPTMAQDRLWATPFWTWTTFLPISINTFVFWRKW